MEPHVPDKHIKHISDLGYDSTENSTSLQRELPQPKGKETIFLLTDRIEKERFVMGAAPSHDL